MKPFSWKPAKRPNGAILFAAVLLLPLLLVTFAGGCKKAESVDLPQPREYPIAAGTAVTIDGEIGEGEWGDAFRVEIPLPNRDSVEAWLKHDGSNLLVLFNLHNPGPASVVFPEILIDANGDRSSQWQQDDRWFHVSATDCDSRGAPLDYSNCRQVQSDWWAEANFASGEPSDVDIIEIAIPFAKAGVAIGRVFGLALCATNTVDLSRFWPATATLNDPASWGIVRLVL